MTTTPNKISFVPANVINDPFTESVIVGNMFNTGVGIEFGEAVAVRICSEVPFYFAFADDDVSGAAKVASDSTRGWRPAGIWVFAYFAEERNLYILAADSGIMSAERLKALSPVIEE